MRTGPSGYNLNVFCAFLIQTQVKDKTILINGNFISIIFY